MSYVQSGPCNVPLTVIDGTGFNTVAVPATQGAQYKSITEQLLYEIWQTLLLILAAQNPPGMVAPITFVVGDGGAFTPVAGTIQWRYANPNGVAIANKLLLVQRNGITMDYESSANHNQIVRFNDGTLGGFDLDPLNPDGALTFQNGERYSIWVVGLDNTLSGGA